MKLFPRVLSIACVLVATLAAALSGCDSDSGTPATDVSAVTDAGTDVVEDVTTPQDTVDIAEPEDTPMSPDTAPGDVDPATDAADAGTPDVPEEPVTGLDPPPEPASALGFESPTRAPDGDPPTAEEIEAFTREVTGFFKDTGYWDWVYWTTHGLDASYDDEMMPYRLWWQGTSMRRDGDTVVFSHRLYAENIAKRTVKVLDGAAAGYMLTGDERMAQVAASLMRGMVALALGFDTARDDPANKYLQARAIFTHNHSYSVDGRAVAVEYDGTHVEGGKWNVNAFEIPDNPTYGTVWVSNMRSKDDVPYMFHTLAVATRIYYETDNEELREAARLYIEYMRGFAQSIVDNDWYILTRYEDGVATIAVDRTRDGDPPADLGSFVHWAPIMGPDAECNAQLGAALAGYGFTAGKGHCDSGLIGREFEDLAGAGNWFNHNIYNYFHIAALSTANLWGRNDLAAPLMEGLVERLVRMRTDPTVPTRDHDEFESDSAGWLLNAASQGYPLNAREARHIMHWYGISADWYRQWEHWDPWASLEDGEELSDYKPPRKTTVDDGEGGQMTLTHIRSVEMPYIFEYCYSPLKAANSVPFIDCDIVADPSQWGE